MNSRATVASLRSSLGGLVDGSALASEAELPRYAVEGVVPKAAVFPATEGQLSAVLALVAREGLAVVPRGNGSLMALGNPPQRLNIVLGLSRMPKGIEHVPGDLTATVAAGSSLAVLQQTLALQGQWLPLDPPLAQRQTIGGMLATNLAGPLSLGYGTARDMVIGMRVAGPDGVITKSGGRVVKNVTGFDVAKVHLGALGTLGVILEASFKVAPLPQRDVTIEGTFPSLGSAIAAGVSLTFSPVSPQALEVAMPPGGECHLYARYMGPSSGVERRLREGVATLRGEDATDVEVSDGEAAAQIWQRLADFGWDVPADDGLLLRLGCLPSTAPEMATALAGVAKQKGHTVALAAGPGRGLTRCYFPDVASQHEGEVLAMVAETRQLAARMGGYAVVERCSPQAKRGLDIWGDTGGGLALMRRLKEQMDPSRLLNPGRFVGGI